jgi:cbb3-type cytochrome oxidase maturation protein
MDVLLWLIPVALGLGLIGLVAFLWSLKSGQFDDLDGAANRILFDDDDLTPRQRENEPYVSRADEAEPRPEDRSGGRGTRKRS